MECVRCGALFTEDWRKDRENSRRSLPRYCSRSCANSRARTNASRKKTSVAMVNSKAVADARRKRQQAYSKQRTATCPVCNNSFLKKHSKQVFCDRACYREAGKRGLLWKIQGRVSAPLSRAGGSGLKEWYRGFWCDSTWELAYIIYNLDHSIPVVRNREPFDYVFAGRTHRYYPDFIVNNRYVEIKGFMRDCDYAKLANFPGSLEIVDSKKIQKYIDYAAATYGRDFNALYEKAAKPLSQCPVCAKQFTAARSQKFCSAKCYHASRRSTHS